MQPVYLGIDPGLSGGMVCLKGDLVVSTAMPDEEIAILEWIINATVDGDTKACIEQVRGFIGGEGHPGSAMFKFGQSYGGLRMALLACGVVFEEVPPRTWQKSFDVVARGREEERGDFKNRLKAKAVELFPWVKITLKNADALLLAEYCRRKHEFVNQACRITT